MLPGPAGTPVALSGKEAESPAAAPGARVGLDGLVKHYGSVRAVDGVTLEVQPGEFLALLGPSGSGKTTILLTIAGFERPTAGRVLIAGRDVGSVAPERRGVGMVFQRYALFPHMTVAQNIGFPLRMRGVVSRERAHEVADALKLVRLSGYESRWPHELSGGQQQRVALARAIVYRPAVLLMDEPLGALDRKLRNQMQLELKQIQARLGTTVIYVTHDQEEALTMADRIAVLCNGSLQQLGTPEQLYERPANAFVADFVGDTNLFAGTLSVIHEGECVVEVLPGKRVHGVLADSWRTSPSAGSAVTLAVRPERVAVEPWKAETSYLSGIVSDTVYAGGWRTWIVDTGEGLVVTAREATSGGARRWRVGEAVELVWAAQDAFVYPADETKVV